MFKNIIVYQDFIVIPILNKLCKEKKSNYKSMHFLAWGNQKLEERNVQILIKMKMAFTQLPLFKSWRETAVKWTDFDINTLP